MNTPLTITLTDDENEALNELRQAKDLSAEQIIRQALRLYQMHWRMATSEPPSGHEATAAFLDWCPVKGSVPRQCYYHGYMDGTQGWQNDKDVQPRERL